MGIGTISAVAVTLIAPVIFGIGSSISTPESSQCYKGKLYVSNIGGLPPDKKDGDGYILLADLKGKVVKPKFITGLNAPKGITFVKGKLFVADIDTVVVADAQTGKIERKIPIPDAKFLNDIAFDGKKTVYVTDTQTNSIYAIDTESFKVSLFLRDYRLQGPNGIDVLPDGKLLVASWGGGKLLLVDGKEVKVLASGFENLDGVVALKDGTVLFSDFAAGRVYRLKDGKVREVYKGFSPADIGYCNGILFVPEFMMNSVKAVRLKK
ncbi:MAG: ATP/GTP-binding protein [Desulfurobacterium sp.]|nr:MAG: ATP/GTP-binding protein [Desulfurobacterium sp.]